MDVGRLGHLHTKPECKAEGTRTYLKLLIEKTKTLRIVPQKRKHLNTRGTCPRTTDQCVDGYNLVHVAQKKLSEF